MKRMLFWASALIASLVLGLGSAALAVMIAGFGGSGETSGPWVTNAKTGSPDAGLYTRAATAVYGFLALSRKETTYYNAILDSAGEVLSGDCTYRLSGRDLPARWWSITAYGADAFLIPNEAHRYSVSQTTIEREPDGSYVAIVSATPQPRNWLPVRAGHRFELTTRLYNPETGIDAGAALPTITRESCS